MSLAENRALAYRVYDAINQQDVTTLDELFDPNIIRHAAGEVGIEKAHEALQKAFAGGAIKRFVVEDVLVDGDKAALRVHVHDTMDESVPPLFIIMEIFRFENGRVAEIWGAGTKRQPSN
ncbi:MAG: nuclear transport factor 2 family protein [Chloroflexota bacterium]